MRSVSNFISAFSATVLLTAIGGGCASSTPPSARDNYNVWKVRCYELSRFYEDKLLKAPYHPIANLNADRCSSPDAGFRWDADARNMHILVANFFYHHDLRVRAKALDMLQDYHCEREETCKQLAHLLDAHITASLPMQSDEWKSRFHQRARNFYRYLLDKQ